MSRKTQIGWISVGVLLCLFSIGLTLKLRDGDKVVAREDNKEAKAQLPDPTPPAPPPVMIPMEKHGVAPASDVANPPPPPLVPFEPTKDLPPPSSFDKTPPPIAFPEGKPEPNWAKPAPLPPVIPGDPKPPMPPPLAEGPPPMPPKPMPDVKKEIQPVSATAKQEPGEPPMVVPAGPVQIYQVRAKTETLPDIARRTLGSSERCPEIVRLNPDLKADSVLVLGTTVRLPPDACIQEEVDAVKPLPGLHAKEAAKPKVLPLTGTYSCTLDEREIMDPPTTDNSAPTYKKRKIMTLPKEVRDQFGNCDTLLVSPGPDHCLWITNHAHLERLADRIEHSPASEADVRVFKRLYYAQTEKTSVTAEGRIAISDKLAQFAGLGQELVLVGIDEHFELWDAAKWKQYTQQKSAAARAAADE